ncbi:hypothetical protein [Tenacibaculum sp. 190524A05c]|uniref:hypothetical protein n=1 Tax=Tenacibaculum platacis TaxID=3137852 RepID=UPI0032B1C088
MTLFLIGIIVITIGWAYYSLAKKYKKNTILYSIVGVICFLFVMISYVFICAFLDGFEEKVMNPYHKFISFIVGVLVSFFLHLHLEKECKKENNIEAEKAIDEIGKD